MFGWIQLRRNQRKIKKPPGEKLPKGRSGATKGKLLLCSTTGTILIRVLVQHQRKTANKQVHCKCCIEWRDA